MAFMAGRMAEMLRPHVEGRDWEFHVDETPREMWRINGIVPPPSECLPFIFEIYRRHQAADQCTDGSDAENLWVETNRAVEWEGAGKL